MKGKMKWMLIAALVILCSCGNKGRQKTKAPIRVKIETVRTMDVHEGQSYVGMVEEREATAERGTDGTAWTTDR